MLEPVVSTAGMEGVRSLGERRLKDDCEIVLASSTSSAYSHGSGGPQSYQVVGQKKCDIVARTQNGTNDEQNRVIGLYDVHLPLDTVLNQAEQIYSPGYIPEWRPNISYAAGAYTTPPLGKGVGDGFYYICLESGVSGAVSPFTNLSTLGHPARDGGAVWQKAGPLFVLEPVADEKAQRSNVGTLVFVCKVVT